MNKKRVRLGQEGVSQEGIRRKKVPGRVDFWSRDLSGDMALKEQEGRVLD